MSGRSHQMPPKPVTVTGLGWVSLWLFCIAMNTCGLTDTLCEVVK